MRPLIHARIVGEPSESGAVGIDDDGEGGLDATIGVLADNGVGGGLDQGDREVADRRLQRGQRRGAAAGQFDAIDGRAAGGG